MNQRNRDKILDYPVFYGTMLKILTLTTNKDDFILSQSAFTEKQDNKPKKKNSIPIYMHHKKGLSNEVKASHINQLQISNEQKTKLVKEYTDNINPRVSSYTEDFIFNIEGQIVISFTIEKVKNEIILCTLNIVNTETEHTFYYKLVDNSDNHRPCFLINDLNDFSKYVFFTNLYITKEGNKRFNAKGDNNFKKENETIINFIQRIVLKLNSEKGD